MSVAALGVVCGLFGGQDLAHKAAVSLGQRLFGAQPQQTARIDQRQQGLSVQSVRRQCSLGRCGPALRGLRLCLRRLRLGVSNLLLFPSTSQRKSPSSRSTRKNWSLSWPAAERTTSP